MNDLDNSDPNEDLPCSNCGGVRCMHMVMRDWYGEGPGSIEECDELYDGWCCPDCSPHFSSHKAAPKELEQENTPWQSANSPVNPFCDGCGFQMCKCSSNPPTVCYCRQFTDMAHVYGYGCGKHVSKPNICSSAHSKPNICSSAHSKPQTSVDGIQCSGGSCEACRPCADNHARQVKAQRSLSLAVDNQNSKGKMNTETPNLPNEPTTFNLDPDSRIKHHLEGLDTLNSLLERIAKALESK